MLTIFLGSVVSLAGPMDAAGEGLSLEVCVLGLDGKPVAQSSVCLWRLVPEGEPVQQGPGRRRRFLWHETETGQVWEQLGGAATGDRWRRDDLPAGTYRATGSLGHHAATPIGVSEPIVLDGRRKNATLMLRLRPGPTVSFRLVDAANNRPVSGARITLVREGSTPLPPWSTTLPATDDRGRVAIAHLPAGTYMVEATHRAERPEEVEYVAVQKPRKLIVSDGVNQIVQVAMKGEPLPRAEIERRWGWVATGTVVNESGHPVADAEVRVATGWNTLMGGGNTRTGPDGRYTLRFAEGWMSPDAANAQAAVFMVNKEGVIEKSRSRPGDHLMARQMPDARSRHDIAPDKIILKGQPYQIDFVVAEPAFLDIELRGPIDSPIAVVGLDPWDDRTAARSVGPNRWELLPGRSWRFALAPNGTRFPIRSFPMTLPRPGRYRAILEYTPDRQGVPLLEILSVTGPVGRREIRDKVVGDDPMARPPVPETLQQRGRELLRRMAEANRPWLGPPPQAAGRYEYRFRFAEQDGQTFRVDARTGVGALRRGISYGSVVHHLAANPAAAVFRQVDVGKDRITLAYTLKEPIGIHAGDGVQGTWHGFFSMPMREGILILDAHRLTPMESRSEALVETFSEYFEVEKDRFAPLAIRVDQLGTHFDWTFQVVEPNLWLFAASDSGDGKVAAQLDRIRVNGAEARPIARGEPRSARAD